MDLQRAVTRRAGYTLVEAVVATALLGIMMVPLVNFFRTSVKSVMKGSQRVAADESLRGALDIIQRDLVFMTELEVAENQSVRFQLDSSRLAGHDPNGDTPDGDGIPNRVDPDRDNDAMDLPATAVPPTFTGYDAWDQDDDDDGFVDVRVRLRLDGTDLVREIAYNRVLPTTPAMWSERTVLCRNVTLFSLEYSGSLAYLSAAADTDGNGIVSETELKSVASGIGDGNGLLDTDKERDSVSVIRVRIEIDQNRDGKIDGKADTEYVPLLMPNKRRTT